MVKLKDEQGKEHTFDGCGIIIEKDDLMSVYPYTLESGANNFTVVFKSKNGGRSSIGFEGEDTFDYFFEMLRRDHDKYKRDKVPLRKKMDRIRLKAIQIGRELDKIKVSQK